MLRAPISRHLPPESPRSAVLSARVLTRVPLPDELVDAIAAALDQEAEEPDLRARSALLAGVRAALEAWADGSTTTGQAVRALRSLSAPA